VWLGRTTYSLNGSARTVMAETRIRAGISRRFGFAMVMVIGDDEDVAGSLIMIIRYGAFRRFGRFWYGSYYFGTDLKILEGFEWFRIDLELGFPAKTRCTNNNDRRPTPCTNNQPTMAMAKWQ